jgi:hypothetical protein
MKTQNRKPDFDASSVLPFAIKKTSVNNLRNDPSFTTKRGVASFATLPQKVPWMVGTRCSLAVSDVHHVVTTTDILVHVKRGWMTGGKKI